jgi:hypothetical protein
VVVVVVAVVQLTRSSHLSLLEMVSRNESKAALATDPVTGMPVFP